MIVGSQRDKIKQIHNWTGESLSLSKLDESGGDVGEAKSVKSEKEI